MLLGMTALSWLVFIPAVACWPVAGVIVWFAWRWSKRHEEHAEEQRKALIEAAARPASDPPR